MPNSNRARWNTVYLYYNIDTQKSYTFHALFPVHTPFSFFAHGNYSPFHLSDLYVGRAGPDQSVPGHPAFSEIDCCWWLLVAETIHLVISRNIITNTERSVQSPKTGISLRLAAIACGYNCESRVDVANQAVHPTLVLRTDYQYPSVGVSPTIQRLQVIPLEVDRLLVDGR